MSLSIDFISKIYNNRNSYAEVFEDEDIQSIHVETAAELILRDCIEKKKLILLTGNPGDGKTHLIKSLKDILEKYNAFVELDINEVKDYMKFLIDLNKAIKEGRPCIIAVNEYPLIAMLEDLGDKFPYYDEILELRNNSIVYSNNETVDYGNTKAVIVDLNNRNLLKKEVLKAALDKIISLSGLCEGCSTNEYCDTPYNLTALGNIAVQERLFKIIGILGNAGVHVVMRDILGFFSYIITAGIACERRKESEHKYYKLIFEGENNLFESIKQFDPYHFTHPEIDEKLWNGTLDDGWLFDKPKLIPSKQECEEDANKVFITNKRKFFFENEGGEELLKFIPSEYNAYFDLLKQAYDSDSDMIKKLVLAINRFFSIDDTEDEKLKVWTTHKYELRNNPEVAVSNKSFSLNEMALLVPRLPKHLERIEYVPNHFLFRVYNPWSKQKAVDLKIDLSFYRTLHLISEGYPAQIVPNTYKFKLYRFMNELASLEGRMKSNEFIIREIRSNYTYKLAIRENKYLPKRG